MNDPVFFLISFLVAGGMALLALNPFIERLPSGSVSGHGSDYRHLIVAGEELNRMVPGLSGEVVLRRADTPLHVHVVSTPGTLNVSPANSPHFRIAADLEQAFSGVEVAFTIRARASASRGAAGFETNYFVGPEGQSGWQVFDLTETFEEYRFVYEVPLSEDGGGVDFFAIRPLAETGPQSMDIEEVGFHLIKRWAPEPA